MFNNYYAYIPNLVILCSIIKQNTLIYIAYTVL